MHPVWKEQNCIYKMALSYIVGYPTKVSTQKKSIRVNKEFGKFLYSIPF